MNNLNLGRCPSLEWRRAVGAQELALGTSVHSRMQVSTFSAFGAQIGLKETLAVLRDEDGANGDEAQGLWLGGDYGPKVRFIPAWGNAHVPVANKDISADGAIHSRQG